MWIKVIILTIFISQISEICCIQCNQFVTLDDQFIVAGESDNVQVIECGEHQCGSLEIQFLSKDSQIKVSQSGCFIPEECEKEKNLDCNELSDFRKIMALFPSGILDAQQWDVEYKCSITCNSAQPKVPQNILLLISFLFILLHFIL